MPEVQTSPSLDTPDTGFSDYKADLKPDVVLSDLLPDFKTLYIDQICENEIKRTCFLKRNVVWH